MKDLLKFLLIIEGMMELIKQPFRWSCVATSFAMVLRVPVSTIFELTGHDGSEVPVEWTEFEEPFRRRGHSIQEGIDVCFQLGYSVTPIIYEEEFITQNDSKPVSFRAFQESVDRLSHYMCNYDGIITGTTPSGKKHAVAWCKDTEMIYDPIGIKSHIIHPHIYIETFWVIQKSNQKLGPWRKIKA